MSTVPGEGHCKTLGLATTVEGVETEAQMQGLQNGNGTNVQGYLFGKPRQASAVAELCRSLGATLAGP